MSIIKPADLFLMFGLTSIAIASMFSAVSQRAQGGYVAILQHGELVHTMPLDTTASHTTTYEAFSNTVQVLGGAATMVKANCPDSHCLNQAPISFSGQSIVCLPNRLVVEVRAASVAPHDVILR